MDDKTMLELAARAAGIGGMHYPKGGWLINGSFDIWNPLTDDGDALRLASTLELEIQVFHGYGEVWADSLDGTARGVADFTSDRAADYRRAIVRAAAEIGKGMGVG